MTRDELITVVSRVGVIGAIRQGAFEDGEFIEVPSVSALMALNTDEITFAATSGYTQAGDGGHGVYYLTRTSTLPATNNVTIFRSNDGKGYWTLIHDGTLDVKQAGAKAGIDCAPAFTAVAAAIVASNGAIGRALFSAVNGGQYTVNNQVLFNCSQITYEFHADVADVLATLIESQKDGLMQA